MKSYKFSYKPPLFEKHRIAVNLDDIRNQLPRNNHKKMNKKKTDTVSKNLRSSNHIFLIAK